MYQHFKPISFSLPSALAFLFPFICFWIPYSLPIFLILMNLMLGLELKKVYWQPIDSKHTKFLRLASLALGWMLLSCLWSPDILNSLRACATLSVFSLLSFLGARAVKHLSSTTLKAIVRSFTGGFLTCIVISGLEILNKGFLHDIVGKSIGYLSEYNRGLTLVIFFFPLGAYGILSRYSFSKKTFLALAGASLFFYASIFTDYDAGKLALWSLPLSLILFYKFQRPLIQLMTVGLVGITLASPFIFKYGLTYSTWRQHFPQSVDSSWLHRLHIWSYVSEKILEKPVLGWGINSSRNKIFQEKLVWQLPNNHPSAPLRTHVTPAISLHPHNIALQVWLELGAVGAIIFSVILSFLGLSLCHMSCSPWARTCFASMFLVACLFSSLSYGAWQSWWYSGLCVAFVGAAIVRSYEKMRNNENVL